MCSVQCCPMAGWPAGSQGSSEHRARVCWAGLRLAPPLLLRRRARHGSGGQSDGASINLACPPKNPPLTPLPPRTPLIWPAQKRSENVVPLLGDASLCALRRRPFAVLLLHIYCAPPGSSRLRDGLGDHL